ncbi:hypothetical protein M8D54_004988 [Salmonella enterica]|uniref:Uncharacterized protein n=1 Tax=Salmonella enterica TaxID=28901 RepID=A0A629KNA9_SALER|nr:hypothetical protein [Salmonella enterica]EDF8922262.1 hypothetical protein [Salmonella enterica]EGR6194446.1 hypothetical protein [Salmonella enterica]EHR7428514.1 hypothetical protein [Salmonella enterica]EJF2005570.1 hypothetical protein [Salmonella enterica]
MKEDDKLIFICTKLEKLYQVYFHMKVDAITDLENRLRDELRDEILNTLASLDENTTKKD